METPTSQMAQLSLHQPPNQAPSPGQQPSPTSPTNGSNLPRPRTGIPRYAIPYRRPDKATAAATAPTTPLENNGATSPLSEGAAPMQPVSRLPVGPIGRGRNGVRTESLGDEAIRSQTAATPQPRYARAASVGEFGKCLYFSLLRSCITGYRNLNRWV